MSSEIESLFALLQWPPLRAAAVALLSLAAALILAHYVAPVLRRLLRRTALREADRVIPHVVRPVFWTVLLAGFGSAIGQLGPGPRTAFVVFGLVKTAIVLTWGVAGLRAGTALIELSSRLSGGGRIVQPTTVPVFAFLLKVVVIAAMAYFALVAWGVNVTGWIASAGIVGVAVGFAAKDTLANLFAGVFILTDAPYKVGDFIVLDGGERGRVTHIGLRSTRILTLDNVEVTIPNATIAAAKIVNETSGPRPTVRLRLPVSVAYGSDVDRVRAVLLSCTHGVEDVCDDPPPDARLAAFGASGLEFEVHVWVTEPSVKERVADEVNTRIYKEFAAAGIEIPYSKHDVYIRQAPAAPGEPAGP